MRATRAWMLAGALLVDCRPTAAIDSAPASGASTATPSASTSATVASPPSSTAAVSPSSPPTSPSSPTVAAPSASAAAASPRAHTLCTPDRPKRKPPYARLEDVDWCEITVVPGFATLHDGTAKVHDQFDEGGQTHVFRLGHVAYGDLDGDGLAEAVVVVDEPTAGNHARVIVFGLAGGNAQRVDEADVEGVVESKVVARTIELTVRRGSKVCAARGALVGGAVKIGPCV